MQLHYYNMVQDQKEKFMVNKTNMKFEKTINTINTVNTVKNYKEVK